MASTSIIIIVIILLFVLYFVYDLYTGVNRRSINEPWLVETTHFCSYSPLTIPSSQLLRSSDSKYGVEFTYSFWMYVRNWPKTQQDVQVFSKGEDPTDDETKVPLLQAPGLWLDRSTNKLKIYMNTYKNFNVDKADEGKHIEIDNIPVKNWFHVTIMLTNQYLDVLINGRLRKRLQLDSPPKQNYGNLYLTRGNGFDGYISRFRYFNQAVPYWRINQFMQDGPSNAPCPVTQSLPPTLAQDWWTRNQ